MLNKEVDAMNLSARGGPVDEWNYETDFVGAQPFLGVTGVAPVDSLQVAESLYSVVILSLSCFENLLKPWCREAEKSSLLNRNGRHVGGLLDILSK